jgi:hypothetical protein
MIDHNQGDNLMVRTDTSDITRLSEVQARTLADWWGGKYSQVMSPERSGEAWHGVIFEPSARETQAMPESRPIAVFSLEEARSLENLRNAVNPEAPDWVG